MTAKAYKEQILPRVRGELREHDLFLFQDLDSAYTTETIRQLCYDQGIDVIDNGPKSADFSVMETMVKEIKQRDGSLQRVLQSNG